MPRNEYNYSRENCMNAAKKTTDAFVNGDEDSVELTRDEYFSWFQKSMNLKMKKGMFAGLLGGTLGLGAAALMAWLDAKSYGQHWDL